MEDGEITFHFQPRIETIPPAHLCADGSGSLLVGALFAFSALSVSTLMHVSSK